MFFLVLGSLNSWWGQGAWRVFLVGVLLVSGGRLPAQDFPVTGAPPAGSAVALSTEAGKKMVAFCQGQLGKKVGDGECSSLAGEALTNASARGISGNSPGDGDYVWGDLACVIEAQGKTNFDRETQARKAKPGDVIQFRDVQFLSGFNGATSTLDHHTAVVVSVMNYGKQIQILEQNYGGHRFVTKSTLNVDDLHKGWMRIYHPVGGV